LDPAARFRDRLHFRDQIVGRDFAILQENLAFVVDGNGQRFFVLVETFSLTLRQIDRHAHRQQRRRDHENYQQHKHHVDHRGHVDFAHHALAMMLAFSDDRRAGIGSHDAIPYPRSSICRERIAANSSAKPSRRWACLLTSAQTWLKKVSAVWRRKGPGGSAKAVGRSAGPPPADAFFWDAAMDWTFVMFPQPFPTTPTTAPAEPMVASTNSRLSSRST